MCRNLIFLSILLVVIGCRDFVTDNFPDPEEKIVMNASLSPMDSIRVHLSKTGNVNADSLALIEDRRVNIYEEGEMIFSSDNGEDGIYKFDYRPIPGKEYKIVLHDNGQEISSRTRIPFQKSLSDVEFIRNVGTDEEGVQYSAIEFSIEADLENITYYQLRIFEEEYVYMETDSFPTFLGIKYNYIPFDSYFEDPVILKEGLKIPVFSSENFPTYPYRMKLSYLEGSVDPFYIELRSISEDYYNYLRSLELYDRGRTNIDITSTVEPVNLSSNVKNGYGNVVSFNSFYTDTLAQE